MPWFRVDNSADTNSKLDCLSPGLFKLLFKLWCMASRHAGVLPPIVQISRAVRIQPYRLENYLEKLISLHLLDRTERGIMPHDWDIWQYTNDHFIVRPAPNKKLSSAARAAKSASQRKNNSLDRKRQGPAEPAANVSEPLSVSGPPLEVAFNHHQHNPSVGNHYNGAHSAVQQLCTATAHRCAKSAQRCALEVDWPHDYRDQFWAQYPHKVGKRYAIKCLEKLSKEKYCPNWEVLISALLRYAAKTDDRPWCNPSTWINQGRWLDQPASPPRRNGVDAALELASELHEREQENGLHQDHAGPHEHERSGRDRGDDVGDLFTSAAKPGR